ncbi:MAG TPA: MmgE/PrpD family protein [Novosphingobium sp.]|nr:MmgE/PrpD family protein [Novosphingobium sp.]
MTDTPSLPPSLTEAVVKFICGMTPDALSGEHLTLARRCVLDGLAVSLGGSQQPGMAPLGRYILSLGGTPDARPMGAAEHRLPAHLAALWTGTAGHAMDWDDTQLAEGPGRPYGLLMHPTMPPLAAAMALTDMVARETGRPVTGAQFLTAFATGFEVGCKIAEAINPDHYMRGFHTSGTIGAFAATAAACRMLDLDEDATARAIGIAASCSAGIRANFGTMTKPFHVGRAAENGVTAALLARQGFSANTEALDGKWGYLTIAGPGGDPALVADKFGAPFTMVSPGVSIKPYPSGVLTHPSMDAMLLLMKEEGIAADDIEAVDLYAGFNVLGPIRYRIAKTELEGKFSFAFLLAAIALRGRCGKEEFTDEFVSSPACQAMQERVETHFSEEIEAMGWDRIRSRVEIVTKDGRKFARWANEDYRGGPHNPLSDRELEGKFADNAAGLLTPAQQQAVFDLVWSLETAPDAGALVELTSWGALEGVSA